MGMRCPNCNSTYSKTRNTYPEACVFVRGRPVRFIPRRKQCVHCGRVWRTNEYLEEDVKPEEDSE